MPGTPSDWVSGERVFAPPRGTVDVDWLVPAVLELVPGVGPAQARAALEQAWLARRGAAPAGSTPLGSPGPGSTDPGSTDPGSTDPGSTDPGSTDPGSAASLADDRLRSAASRVIAEALDTFGG